MASATATTVLKMIDSLPEPEQERVLEHLREYIEDVREDAEWNEAFARSQDKLAAAGRKAKAQIAQGLATPLDPDQL